MCTLWLYVTWCWKKYIQYWTHQNPENNNIFRYMIFFRHVGPLYYDLTEYTNYYILMYTHTLITRSILPRIMIICDVSVLAPSLNNYFILQIEWPFICHDIFFKLQFRLILQKLPKLTSKITIILKWEFLLNPVFGYINYITIIDTTLNVSSIFSTIWYTYLKISTQSVSSLKVLPHITKYIEFLSENTHILKMFSFCDFLMEDPILPFSFSSTSITVAPPPPPK